MLHDTILGFVLFLCDCRKQGLRTNLSIRRFDYLYGVEQPKQLAGFQGAAPPKPEDFALQKTKSRTKFRSKSRAKPEKLINPSERIRPGRKCSASERGLPESTKFWKLNKRSSGSLIRPSGFIKPNSRARVRTTSF